MKPLHWRLLCVTTLLLGIFSSGGWAEQARTFTDVQGRQISAELLSHDGNGTIELKLTDGQVFNVPIATFSLEDQSYIQEFVKKNPVKLDYNFDVQSSSKKISGTRQNLGYKVVKSELWSYEVVVENRSRDTVGDLDVEYRIFTVNEADGGFVESDLSLVGLRFHTGQAKVKGPLRYNQRETFVTKPVRLDSVDYDYGYSGDRHKDSLRGLMVRIKDSAGNVVHEYVSPITTLKDKTWDSIPKELEAKE